MLQLNYTIQNFHNDLGKLAAERNSVKAINGAVSSGDHIQVRLHVIYNETSSRIREDMDKFFTEHKKLSSALLKSKGLEWIGDTDKAFANMYTTSLDPKDRMTLKSENDPSLSKEEKAFITFFNDAVLSALLRTSPQKYHAGIIDGTLWKRGTIPTIYSKKEFFEKDTFKSWTNLRTAIKDQIKLKQKDTTSKSKNFLNFGFTTQFDQQATDASDGHSELRRNMLGIKDINNPTEPHKNIETNLALILNLATLEAAEKVHFDTALQTVVAAQSVLASQQDPSRTGMSSEMIETWKEIVIFNRYKDEPIAPYIDPLNRFSSEMLFSYSLRQAMIEASTGTLQTASSLLSNSIQNVIARIVGDPEHGGRYNITEFAWATRQWNKYDPMINQLVYDCGMLVADPDDLRSADFFADSKFKIFKSEAAFWLNRLFFNSAITHTFLAQMKHQGITDAYVKKGDKYVYDETLDSRFFVYDKEAGLGERMPETDEEKKKYSVWKATRKMMSDEGSFNVETQRMTQPLTANERAEIKHYATRTYGTFNKDGVVNAEALVVGRSMLRYKKWAMQKIANWYTPTVNDDMWGHWESVQNPDGSYHTNWVGDDFEGIIQTIGHITKEIASLRAISAFKNLNKYQKENLSKLLADLAMVFMMLMLVLPFFADQEEEVDPITGKVTKVTGDFGKNEATKNAFKAMTNATSDMFFVLSVVGIGSGPAGNGILSSVLPGLGTIGTSTANFLKGTLEIIKPDGEPGKDFVKIWNQSGLGRSGSIISAPFTSNQ